MIKTGNYYWNAGMFIAQAKYLLSLFKTHLPQHHKIISDITKHDSITVEQLSNYFSQFESYLDEDGVIL